MSLIAFGALVQWEAPVPAALYAANASVRHAEEPAMVTSTERGTAFAWGTMPTITVNSRTARIDFGCVIVVGSFQTGIEGPDVSLNLRRPLISAIEKWWCGATIVLAFTDIARHAADSGVMAGKLGDISRADRYANSFIPEKAVALPAAAVIVSLRG